MTTSCLGNVSNTAAYEMLVKIIIWFPHVLFPWKYDDDFFGSSFGRRSEKFGEFHPLANQLSSLLPSLVQGSLIHLTTLNLCCCLAICVEHTFWSQAGHNTGGKTEGFIECMHSSLSLYQQSSVAATVKCAILEAFKNDLNLLSDLESAEDYPRVSKQLEAIALSNLMRHDTTD